MFFRHSKPKEPTKPAKKRSRAEGTVLQWCFKKFDEKVTIAQICRERPEISPSMVRRYHASWRRLKEVASNSAADQRLVDRLNVYFSVAELRSKLMFGLGKLYQVTEADIARLLGIPRVLDGPVNMGALKDLESYRKLLVLGETLKFLERHIKPSVSAGDRADYGRELVDKALSFLGHCQERRDSAGDVLRGISALARFEADLTLARPGPIGEYETTLSRRAMSMFERYLAKASVDQPVPAA